VAEANVASHGAPLFTEVTKAVRDARRGFEVVCPGGEVLRVPSDFDGASLRRALAAVRGMSPC
jgi:hypothetical protein